MITYQLKKSVEVFRNFNRFSTFLLIGNNLGGYINVKIVEFKSFEEVIKRFPRIINDLAFYGKWDLCLYQVPKEYQLIEKPRSYKIPKNGERIFKLDHVIATSFIDIFVNFSMIHLALSDKKIQSESSQGNTSFIFRMSEIYLTIELEEKIDQKTISLNQFNGDKDKLFDGNRY